MNTPHLYIIILIVTICIVLLWLIKKNQLAITIFLFYIKRRGLSFGLQEIKRQILSSFGKLQLMGIFISPSHQCNADCVHCYEKFANKVPKSLTTEQVKNIIDQFKKLGGSLVYFCSGEFLMRTDALELIKYVRDNRMIATIVSNGILLNETKINELKAVGLTEMIVSIDSVNPERHDELRGVKGCFEKATNGLRIAKEKGISTEIWTYISKSNYKELDGIAELGRKLKVDYVFVYFPCLSGHMFNKFEENLTLKDREEFRKKYNGRRDVRLEFPSEKVVCRGGGKEHIHVLPSGDVTFCPPVPYSYGNIFERSLKDCLKDIKKDHKRFCNMGCTGECIVNFPEYREKSNARFIYE